jgi:hypothetical protein
MKVAIHQPEHFPYMGFFEKMKSADLFVILDNVKFQGKRSWQNRNLIKLKNGTDFWLTVPIAKNSYDLKINEVQIAPDYGWKKKLLKTVKLNLGVDLTDVYNSETLMEVNMKSIKYCREQLDITTPMVFASDMDILGTKTERIYNICKNVNATKYISGLGSKDYMDLSVFKDIDVEFFKPTLKNNYSVIYNLCCEK